MKILKYKWILIFFILWLPLQGAASAVLSVCVQEDFSKHHESMIMADNHHLDDYCHNQSANTSIDYLIASLACDNTSCEAYHNPPILSGDPMAMFTDNAPIAISYNSGFVSFMPKQPQRPPLVSLL
jgi:hypothetical protein